MHKPSHRTPLIVFAASLMVAGSVVADDARVAQAAPAERATPVGTPFHGGGAGWADREASRGAATAANGASAPMPRTDAADAVFPMRSEPLDRGAAMQADRSVPEAERADGGASMRAPAVGTAASAHATDRPVQGVASKPVERVSPAGVRYMTGGVSVDEADMMRRAAPRYGLALTFASPGGAFQSDVDVTVSEARRGEVLSVVSGPMLLVDLPAGRYTVEATLHGRTQTHHVNVQPHGHRALVVRFDDATSPSRYAADGSARR